MAFNPALLTKLQPSTLFTDPATIPAVQAQTPAVQFWLYNSGADTLAVVTAAGYFNYFGNSRTVDTLLYNNAQLFNVGDLIWCVCQDQNSWIEVTAVAPAITTDVPAVAPGNIPLANTHILVGNAANIAIDVAMGGDATIANTGVVTIANGAINNAKINAAAAIDFSKLAALVDGNILVGSVANVATSVAMGGDATITNAGVLTIANDAVTTAKILNANVTLAKLAAGITPSHVVKFAGQPTTVGGAAAEAFAIPGVLNTDLAFVQIVDNGAGNVTALQAVCTADTLTVTFSADPGNDVIFNYQILRAAV